MERVSGAWMATVKPHGWVHAALGMGGARPSINEVNNFFFVGYFFVIYAWYSLMVFRFFKFTDLSSLM